MKRAKAILLVVASMFAVCGVAVLVAGPVLNFNGLHPFRQVMIEQERYEIMRLEDRVRNDVQVDTSLAELIEYLDAEDPYVRQASYVSLGRLGSKAESTVPLIAAKLDQNDGIDARWAAGCLYYIGSSAKCAVPALISALDGDRPADVRYLATKALGEIGPEAVEALPALERVARSEHGFVSRGAERAVKRISVNGEDEGCGLSRAARP